MSSEEHLPGNINIVQYRVRGTSNMKTPLATEHFLTFKVILK